MAPPAHAWSGGAPGRRSPAARRRRNGVVALQQGVGNRAFGALMRRQLQRDPKTFEQEIQIGGIEYSADGVNVSSGVSEELLAAAQKSIAKGPLKDVKDLKALRKLALADETISDSERLFLAALMDPANVELIKAVDMKGLKGLPLKLKFTLDDATAKRLREVADLGRPAKVSDDIGSLAGDSKRIQKHAASLVAFAKERKVPLKDVAEAMRAAASDSTAGDMVAAGGIYAVAAAAKHPLADDIKAGRIKVDEMPRSQIEGAVYVPTAKGRLEKGDTIYVKPSFDVADLRDRATAIHELEHARQDSKESAPVLKDVVKVEPEAYVAGSRYVLEEIAALPDKKRPDAQKKVAEQFTSFDMYAAVIAAKADAKLMPVLKAINALRKTDDQLSDDDFKKSDDELKERIVDRLGEHARGQVRMSGFAGESVFDLKRAQTK